MRKVLLLSSVLFLAADCPAWSQQTSFSDFVGSEPGSLYGTSADPNDKGAGGMVWTKQECSGHRMLLFRKGLRESPYSPWGSEDHFLENGFWKQLAEKTYEEGNGGLTLNRTFRDAMSFRKGVIRFPEAISGGGGTPIPVFWEEYHGLTCDGVISESRAGSVFRVTDGVYGESFGEYVIDCRSPSRKPGKCGPTPVPVSFWQHVEWWNGGGGVNVEIYRFARWRNPDTGASEGLGLIEWTHGGPAWPNDCPSAENPCVGLMPYVVPAATPNVPCMTCPD